MPRRRRLLALSALLAFVFGISATPLIVAPALADGVLQILTPSTGSGFTWDAAPNALHITGTTTDLPTDVEIYDGSTFIGSCTPDALGAFDCGVPTPYPGPHTINAQQGGVTHDSISITVVYPAMNVPLTGFTENAVSGGTATFSGQAMLYSAGYEFGYASVDFGGGDVRSCWNPVDSFGGWVCNLSVAGVADGSYPVEVWTTGGPATGVHTAGTLVIAPYAVPVPVIDVPEPTSHMTTNGAVVVGGNYDFGALSGGQGGFVTVTIDGTNYCATDFYDSSQTSWSCEIFPAFGMNSVTAKVTEGDLAGQMSLPSATYVIGRGTSGDPTLDTPLDGAVIADGATVNFSGTGPIISQPIVEIRDYPAGVGFTPWCYGNVIGPAGTWSCPPSTTLNPGEWEVRVSTEDVNGVTTTSTPILVTQQASSSVGGLVILSPFGGDFPQYGPTFTMNGFAPTGDPLSVLLDGVTHACDGISPFDNGLGGWDWYCNTSAPGAVPLPGPHTLEVVQDPGVVQDSVAFTVISGPPSVDALPLEAGLGDTTFDVSGTANYFPSMTSQVHIEVVGYPAAGCVSLDVNSFGGWSCVLDLTGIPVDDDYQLNVWQEDDGVVGAVGAQFLDVLAPTPTLTIPAVGGYDTLGSTVTVGGLYDFSDLPGGMGGQIYVNVVDPDGNDAQYCGDFATGHFAAGATSWSCDIPLAVGVNEVSMVIANIATDDYTLDSNMVAIRRGTADPIALSYPADGSTVQTPLTFAGTGPALANFEVQVRKTGSGLPFTTQCATQVDADGSWECFNGMPVGAWDVQVTATDLLGTVTTTPITAFTAAYNKPTMTYTPTGTNAISAHAASGASGWLTMWFYSIDDTSDPTQYGWGAAIPSGCPASVSTQSTCSFGAPELTPGIWNVFTVDEHDNPPTAIGSAEDDYFYVPETPAISPAINADGSLTISATREAGTRVTVRDLATNAVACTISGPGTGGACTISTTPGSHQYSAQAQSVGFVADTGTPGRLGDDSIDWFSGVANSAAIVVPVPPATPTPHGSPTPTPSPTPVPTPWTWSFSYSPHDAFLHPGDTVDFTGTGVPTGATITIELHSTPIVLGSTTAADDGTFAYTAVIPDDVEAGAHHFVLTATPPGEEPSVLQEPISIELPLVDPIDDDPEPVASHPPTDSASGGSGGGSGDRSNPAAPSFLTDSLVTFAQLLENPFALVLSGGLTLALLFLVAFPTEILNSTLSENTGRLGRGFVALEGRLERLKTWFLRVTRSRALASAILVLLLSIIYGFTDPAFGFDLVSVRTVLSLAVAMFILTYLIGWLTGLLSRWSWGVYSQVEFQPAVALFAVVGVIVARLLEFTPGFFVGVVIGLELLQASHRVAARVALLQFTLVVAVGVGAWLAYSALASGGAATDFGSALLGDTLVALTAEGLTAAAIAILPLRFLEGRSLFRDSKLMWLIAFLIIEFAFVLLVLPTALEGTDVGDIAVWIAVFGAFGIVTFTLWAIFARIERRREHAEKLERNTAQHDEVRG